MKYTNAKLIALAVLAFSIVLSKKSTFLKEDATTQLRRFVPYMHVASATPADTTLNWIGTVIKITCIDHAEIDCNKDGVPDFEVRLPAKEEFSPGSKVFGTIRLPLRDLNTDIPLVVAKL